MLNLLLENITLRLGEWHRNKTLCIMEEIERMALMNQYKIDCQDCRKSSVLSYSEYIKQLRDTTADGWVCPHCSSENCTFDEQNYRKIMGVNRKEE